MYVTEQCIMFVLLYRKKYFIIIGRNPVVQWFSLPRCLQAPSKYTRKINVNPQILIVFGSLENIKVPIKTAMDFPPMIIIHS